NVLNHDNRPKDNKAKIDPMRFAESDERLHAALCHAFELGKKRVLGIQLSFEESRGNTIINDIAHAVRVHLDRRWKTLRRIDLLTQRLPAPTSRHEKTVHWRSRIGGRHVHDSNAQT